MQNATAAKPIFQFPSARNCPPDLAEVFYRKLLSCKKMSPIRQNRENNAPIPDICQTALVIEFEGCWRRLVLDNFIQFLDKVFGFLICN